jgi:hypothetical protein
MRGISKCTDIFRRIITESFNDLEFSYTPPLTSPWDPAQMATQAWDKTVS